MACRGYFLALDERCTALLLAQDGNDERLIDVIQELDMTDAPDHCEVSPNFRSPGRCSLSSAYG